MNPRSPLLVAATVVASALLPGQHAAPPEVGPAAVAAATGGAGPTALAVEIDAPGAWVEPDLLAVKLRAACDPMVQDGVLLSRNGTDLTQLRALFDRAAAQPMITGVDRAVLDAWHARACERLPAGQRPGHLAHWFYLRCADAEAALELRAALRQQPLVEHCYREPRWQPASRGMRDAAAAPVLPGDPFPPTPYFGAMQATLDPAPVGVGLRWANGILGGRGQAVKLRQVEEDWFVDHEDISRLTANAFLVAAPPGNTNLANHGTAGISLVIADRNGFGLTGGADEVDIAYVAFPVAGGIGNAIVLAAADADPGDILMMVVMMLWGQAGPDDWVPVELVPAVYDVVRTVTINDRIVVATAANGGRSLDDPRFAGAFDRAVRDSGAVFVGASEAGQFVPWQHCNFGAICDASSWGTSVVAAGYGDLFYGANDRRQAYTSNYSGTSPAVPVVTAVAAAIQGGARRQLGRNITGPELRQLLRAHGSPVAGQVGDRPDVRAIFQTLGIYDGLELSGPDTAIGTQVQVIVSSAAPGGAVLLGSFGTGDTNLGFNRALHLDAAATATLDFRVLSGGQAAFSITVPNVAALSGVSLYVQAAVLPASGPIHVTNSGQVTVL